MRLQKITLGKIRNGKIMIKQDYIVKVIKGLRDRKNKKWQDYDKTRLHCESNSGLWDRKNKKWQE